MKTTHNVRGLLSVSADAKTVKGEKRGYLTGVMYLAPANASGYETCKYRSAGCTAGCLYTAGRAAIFPEIPKARINRTRLFFENRSEFWKMLIRDIDALCRKAEREGLTPVVRLNGTSDLPWERIPVVIDGNFEASSIINLYPGVQFYDYTKWPIHRRIANVPANYDLTFSLSEENDAHAMDAIEDGYRVAVVFDVKRSKPLPATWRGVPVVDGDDSDLRFLEEGGVYVGLRAKGDARKDTSGFVRSAVETEEVAA